MKELKEICDDLIMFFGIKTIDELGDTLKKIVFSPNKNEIYDKYLDIVGTLNEDWIQKIFQYYKSNRDDLKQDYTPKALSTFLAKLLYKESAMTCYDVCCGSGSLTIEMYKLNNNMKFICHELDEKVIPFLLFNLSIHNINGIVIQGDVIRNKQYRCYELISDEKYSNIQEISNCEIKEYDIVISNPPFNLDIKNLYINYDEIEIEKSSNSYFLIYCLSHLSDWGKMGIILPTGFLSSQKNEDIMVREYLLNNDILDSVISMPGDFFESTAVNTSVICVDKNKKDTKCVLVDNSKNNCSTWIRKQRGQFGGAAHTNRVYEKKFNTLSNDNITYLYNTINKRISEDEYSVVLGTGSPNFIDKGFSYAPGQHFKLKVTQYVFNARKWKGQIPRWVFDMASEEEQKKVLEILKENS